MTEIIKLDDDELIDELIKRYKDARRYSAGWRREARDLYKFRAGHQWTDEELAYLEGQRRPPVTFNRAGTIIDAVVGNEIGNRQEIRYFPRTLGDSPVNEVATNAVRWVRDQCNAEDEESDAFEDVLIGGMGWIETRVDYDNDLDGRIVMERVDPLEMYWDSSASKHNLEDAQVFFREKWIDKEELKAMWPDAGDIVPLEDAAPELDNDIRNADPPFYEREVSGYDRKKNQVRVLHCVWCERAPFYRVLNPMTNAVESIPAEKFKKLKQRIPEIRSVRQQKKRWYKAFIAGGTLLEKGVAPIPELSSFQCITGKRDREENSWFGLMRGIKEPQEWANKFFSQILHIINSNSKGGFFFESGALKDPQKAEEDLAKPEGMVELNPGGIARIKERQMFQFPASIDRMLEFAISSIRDVPGVNLELLGLTNRDQAGVLEAQRQRQALAVLAPIFSNLRRYRKNEGRLLLAYIRDYIADGRLIRIVGEEGAQVAPLIKDQLTTDYDIIVDQAPTSPNVKTEAWVALTQVLPVLQAAGFPIPKEIVDILPLPEALIGKWKEQVKSGQTLPPEVQQQMQALQEEIQKLTQKNQVLQAKHDLKAMDMQAKHQLDAQRVDLERQKIEAELSMKFQEMIQTLALEQRKFRADIALQLEELRLDAAVEKGKAGADGKDGKKPAKITMPELSSVQEITSRNSSPPIRDIVVNVDKPKRFKIERDRDGQMSSIEVQ